MRASNKAPPLLTEGDSVGAYLPREAPEAFGPRLGRDIRRAVSRLLSPFGRPDSLSDRHPLLVSVKVFMSPA